MARWEQAPPVDNAPAWSRAPAVGAPDADTSRNRARSVLSGLSLGFGDELTGGLVAAIGKLAGDQRPFREIYEEVRDYEREGLGEFRRQRPGLSTALEVAGSVATGGAGAARLAGTRAAQRLAAQPLRNRMLAASAGGATGGAITGAGEAETVADIPAEAVRAAAPGALLGPAAELGGTAIGRVAQALTPQRSAERAVARGIERTGLTPQQAAARAEALGPGATLADVGEGTAAMLETAANQPGATRGAAARQLMQRSRRQAEEVTAPLGPGRVAEMADALQVQRTAAAGPLYAEAFEQGVTNTPTLRGILNRSDSVQRAWRRARRMGADDAVAQGIELDPRMLGTEAEPSLQGWQAITMQLGDMIESAKRGANPRPSEARRLTAIKDRINAAIDSQNDAYRQARETWAGSKAFEETMEQGRDFLRADAGQVVRDLRKMSDTERMAYRAGAAQALEDRLLRMTDTHDVTRLMRNEAFRRKARALFGDSADYADFLNRIEAAAAKQRTMGQVLGNSATARRLAQADEEGLGQAVAGAVADVATGAPVQTVAGGGLRSLARRIPTSREATRDQIGQMLLEADPIQRNRILALIESGGTPYQRGTSGIGVPLALGVGGATMLPPGDR